jgi:hypothetical protein
VHLILVCCAISHGTVLGGGFGDCSKYLHVPVGFARVVLVYFCTCRTAQPLNFFIPTLA